MCHSEQHTAGLRGPRTALWTLASCYSFTQLFSLSLFLLITITLPHSALFPETCRSIYRRVVGFFNSLCLFVALRSTEGFLAADVSSVALQDGGEGREKDTKGENERQKITPCEKRKRNSRIGSLEGVYLVYGKAFAWSLSGEWKVYFRISAHTQSVYLFLSHPLSLI